MLNIFLERIHQKHRTSPYPKTEVNLPPYFNGKPEVDLSKCQEKECAKCVLSCPTKAIEKNSDYPEFDLGKCIFCQECTNACPGDAICFSRDYKMATTRSSDLILRSVNDYQLKKADELKKELLSLYGRSFKLRQVSAAGCNACEADTNVLGTLFFDLSRFGIQFVASPRHADGILVTGPVSKNMELALKKTYAAVPGPKIVIAVGACAISGGLFQDHEETLNGVDKIIPTDLFIPGCPPHPLTILDGLLRLLKKSK